MKMYMTNKWDFNDKIEVVEVERKTEKTVWIDGRRHAQLNDYHAYFDTFDEAKTYLLGVAESKLDAARRNLENAQGYMGNVKGLKEI